MIPTVSVVEIHINMKCGLIALAVVLVLFVILPGESEHFSFYIKLNECLKYFVSLHFVFTVRNTSFFDSMRIQNYYGK